MRYALGRAFSLAPPATAATTAPLVKIDVDVLVKGVEGGKITLTIPPTDATVHNHLIELRAYLIPQGQPIPGDADTLVASAYLFAPVNVSHPGWSSGGDVDVTLPEVADDLALYAGQLVHGYEE